MSHKGSCHCGQAREGDFDAAMDLATVKRNQYDGRSM